MKNLDKYFISIIVLMSALYITSCSEGKLSSPIPSTNPRKPIKIPPTLNISDQTVDQGQAFAYILDESRDISDLDEGEGYTIEIISDEGMNASYDSTSKILSGNPSNLSPGIYFIVGRIEDDDKNKSTWTFSLTIEQTDVTPPTLNMATQTIIEGQSFFFIVDNTQSITDLRENENYTISITNDSNTGMIYASRSMTFFAKTDSLLPGIYSIEGKISDDDSNISTWSFDLIIQAALDDQTPPSLSIAEQKIQQDQDFSYMLDESNDISNLDINEIYTISISNDGGSGVTYTESSKTFEGSTSTFSPGTYVIVGTINDNNNNSSTWVFTLTIEGDDIAPRFNIMTQTISRGEEFTYNINESNDILDRDPNDENYTITVVNDNGTGMNYDQTLKTFSGQTSTLNTGTYVIIGKIEDNYNNESIWAFNLVIQTTDNIAPNIIIPTQTVSQGQTFFLTLDPLTDITNLRSGESYMIHITDDDGIEMLYTPQSQTLVGKTATLPPRTYTIQGTITDEDNNSSVWSFDLVIPEAQAGDDIPPYLTIVVQNINEGEDFSYNLQDSDFSNLEVGESFTIDVTNDSGAQISYRGISKSFIGDTDSLGPGIYAIIGTITDSNNNSSTWVFTLRVIADDKVPELTIPVQVINQGQDFTYTLNENRDISNLEPGEDYTIAIIETDGTGVTFNNISKVFEIKASSLLPRTYLIRGVITDSNSNSNIWAMALTIIPDHTPPQLNIGAQTSDQDTDFIYMINENQDISDFGDWESYTVQITDKGGIDVVYSETSKTFTVPTEFLLAGAYSFQGTITDAYSNSSPWVFSLTIQQSDFTAPILGIQQQEEVKKTKFTYTLNELTDISSLRSGEGYTIAITSQDQSKVTYNATSREFNAPTSSLSVGIYLIEGTITDDNGNTSNWSFNLRIYDQVPPQLLLHSTRIYVGDSFSLPLRKGKPMFQVGARESFTINITNNGGIGVVYDQETTTFSASTSTVSQGTYTIEGNIIDGDNNETIWSIDLIIEYPNFLLKSIALGKNHTCAVTPEGTEKCWGSNDIGKLGIGDEDNSLVEDYPVDVITAGPYPNERGELPIGTQPWDRTPLSGVLHVSASLYNSCSIMSGGSIKCWGKAAFSGLGHHNEYTQPARTPVDVRASNSSSAMTGFVDVGMGETHTCALTTEGGVKCWGSGDVGQLGNYSLMDRDFPVNVVTSSSRSSPHLRGVIQIAVGRLHNCALLANKTVKCWGEGTRGQLGYGTSGGSPPELAAYPVLVKEPSGGSGNMEDIIQITAGAHHSCLLKLDGTVYCCGDGRSGQIGRNTNFAAKPVKVYSRAQAPLVGIQEIISGDNISCALNSKKQVLCWGRGGFGELGNHQNYNSNANSQPVYVVAGDGDQSPLTGVNQILGGWRHTCGVMDSGIMHCWGSGQEIRLGDGSRSIRTYPSPVLTSSGGSPLKVKTFRRSYTCTTGSNAACYIDPIVLSFTPGTSSPSSSDVPEIMVSGINDGESVHLYSDESCRNQSGNQATLANSTVSISGITIGSHRFYYRVFNSSDEAITNCSRNFIGYERE